MNQKILLIEIQTEDLPSKELKNIANFFYYIFKKKIKENKIQYKKISLFFTSKKLVLKVFSLKNIKKKKNHLIYIHKKKTISLKEKIKKIVFETIKKIPLKRSMLWDEKSIRFSRPIRNIMILLNKKIIKAKIEGITSNSISYGHFLMSPKKIIFHHANQYTKKFFKKKKIILDYQERKKKIIKQIKNLTKKHNKKIYINKNLLKEISVSIEWPIAHIGKFKKKYLNIPQEILIYIIENNQKYFSIFNTKKNTITNYFIFISNIETPNFKKIIQENEQVLSSKLKNINFFLKKDLLIKFSNRLDLLKNISFQKKLGSMYEKTIRIKKISQYISKILKVKKKSIKRAAILSKCDLTTNIIRSTTLQGIIGMYYALYNHEDREIALAIKEHYLPNFSQSNLPTQLISCILSISDKIDTITGIFSISKVPKNNKDPFALRRSTIGIIKIIIKKKIYIDIIKLIKYSINLYTHIKNKILIQKLILNFIYSKFQSLYLKKKYNKKIISSVLSLKLNDLLDINNRIHALYNFQKINNMKNILNIYKRITNILKQKKEKKTKINIFYSNPIYKFSIYEKKIIILIKSIIENNIKKEKNDYFNLLKKIEELCTPIKEFFQNILINDKNTEKRLYRISILQEIKKIFLYITNFSYL
ncbi:glycine--tRNA ligase subunit beta [Buchnera aphidicola]|uniref:Glycine--tRNA ligase beta subunit n=1 Tax=Buchnera aphidicola subsp. Cinara cedri (strain Cc) TaxID=372461 RepID=Q057Y7_BUCCC|nr:glycine--tRNA ligase subunit beta [Buchnera aphidicola]ABJ90562.1 glycyl-tRNA synthetase, b subunit [Buchnera aphidicola BCc]